ncbi:MAG: insulinase family protein [Gammaproteobacteria bacterium]|nr:insulinase family protein [Gammaproteobacteria bacterium]
MRLYILLCSLFFIISSNLALANSAVNEYQLPNGLKVLIKEDHRVPAVVTQVWYRVGSSYEPNGITGISHALEHMMFKGTTKYGPGMFSKTVAENGGEENAFTSYDYTAYYQLFEVNKLPISLELESDRMRNLNLRDQDFLKELEVVKEERRLRTDDNPQNLTFERFLAVSNVASPYHHPVIGWMWDLNEMKVTDVQKWYQTWYAPNNAVLVIVGDVKPDETFKLVQKYFGPLKAGVLPPVKQPGELKNIGLRRMTVATPAKLPLIVMGFNTPALKTAPTRKEAYALDVLQAVLGGGDSARFPTKIVRGKQLATDIQVGYDIFSRLDNIFSITAIPSQGKNNQLLENAILEEIKLLQTSLISPQELERVKAQVIANKTYEKDSIMNQANEIGSLEAVNLTWRESENYVKEVSTISAADVQAVAKKYLILDRLTIATLKPLPLNKNTQDQPIVNTGGQSNVR